MSTIHADSGRDVLRRLEDLIAEVSASSARRAIAQAVDLIVHIARAPMGRRVEAILRIGEGENGEDYAVYVLAWTQSRAPCGICSQDGAADDSSSIFDPVSCWLAEDLSLAYGGGFSIVSQAPD